MSKVIAIGIDGLAWRLIDRLNEDVELPNFERLRDDGAHGELRTTVSTTTVPAIPAMYTGMNSFSLGIYGFAEGEELVTHADIDAKPVWEYVNDTGIPANVVNVPTTFPPDKIDGTMISGMMTPSSDSDYTHPPALKERFPDLHDHPEQDILGICGDSRACIEEHRDELLEIYTDQMRRRFRAFQELDAEQDDGLSLLWVKTSDNIQHFFYDDTDILTRYFTELDELLGEIIEEHEYDTLIVFSDHGFEHQADKVFHVNEFLRQEGYLETSVPPIVGRLVHRIGKLMPNRLKSLYFRMQRDSSTDDEKNTLSVRGVPGIDYDGSTAYYGSLGIDIADGVNNREAVRDNIIAKLRALEHDGEPITQFVAAGSGLFDDDRAPDILFYPAAGYATSALLADDVITSRDTDGRIWSGKHNGALYGVISVLGDGVEPGDIDGARIYDLMPTILALLDHPVPEDVDGRVLEQVVSPEKVTYQDSTALEGIDL